jgi:hypothetical protein
VTFYYDSGQDELVGNNMFWDDNHDAIASRDGDTLKIDVTTIMEDGRGLSKLREMRDSLEDAIAVHDGE